jgi:hypothetical protein
VKRLEHEKVQVQVQRRLIHAPLAGVISRVRKEVGEFVAPNDPHLIELVCLDPLMATFNVPSYLAKQLQGETARIGLSGGCSRVGGGGRGRYCARHRRRKRHDPRQGADRQSG